jgi:nitrogen fixation protein FixH
MNWGYKIVISAFLFMGYIVFLVTKCFQQDVSLVDQHYYKEEIEYQAQIEKMKNANQSNVLSIKYLAEENQVKLQFKDDPGKEIQGKVQLFRPSNEKLDKAIPLELNESGAQYINTQELAKGLWKMKVYWSDGNVNYFKEELVVL